MTCEATNHVAFWYTKQLTTDFDMVSVLSELLESEGNEVLGITNRIKQTLKKEVVNVMATKEELKRVETKIDKVEASIKEQIEAVAEKNEKDISKVLSAIATLQSSINNQGSSEKKPVAIE